jgi:hypothetical protein
LSIVEAQSGETKIKGLESIVGYDLEKDKNPWKYAKYTKGKTTFSNEILQEPYQLKLLSEEKMTKMTNDKTYQANKIAKK